MSHEVNIDRPHKIDPLFFCPYNIHFSERYIQFQVQRNRFCRVAFPESNAAHEHGCHSGSRPWFHGPLLQNKASGLQHN